GRIAGLPADAGHAHAEILDAGRRRLGLADLVRLADDPIVPRAALADAVGGIAGGRRVQALDRGTQVVLLGVLAATRRPQSRSQSDDGGQSEPMVLGVHRTVLTRCE